MVSSRSRLSHTQCDAHLEAARQAGEPIFSLNHDDCFLSLGDILHISLNDPALMNAFMLTLAFTVNGCKADAECLSYKGNAICHLNQKIRCSKDAAGESTIRAILLLAGIEVRPQIGCIGMPADP
jgi:hypothetical protein